jgi:hypothetical protein
MLGLLQLVDEGRRLVTSEPSGGLALREAHGTSGVPEVRVASVPEESQQLLGQPR